MSWSVMFMVGTKSAVTARASAAFDTAAKMYEGKPEGEDVLRCKASALAALEEIDPKLSGCNGVSVEASGSRGSSYGTNFKLAVLPVNLVLDEPAPPAPPAA